MSDDNETCKELIRNCLNYAPVHLERDDVICHTLNNHGVTGHSAVDRQQSRLAWLMWLIHHAMGHTHRHTLPAAVAINQTCIVITGQSHARTDFKLSTDTLLTTFSRGRLRLPCENFPLQ